MKIAVYCSAARNLPEHWIKAAEDVGVWIGRHGAELVYGGVDAGLMTVVAKSTKKHGGRVTGVVPVLRFDQECRYNDVRIPTADLASRKRVLQLLGDVFVVLPGGYGTLDEFISTFAHISFTGLEQPIILFNDGGLFDPTLAQLRLFEERGVMRHGLLDKIIVVGSGQELIRALDRCAEKIKI